MTVKLNGVAHADDFTLDVALDVSSGQRATLIGPNGSGKSTVLRLIAGLASLSSGHLEVFGVTYDAPPKRQPLPPQKRSVGMVFQDHRLFDHLSVADNVGFGLEASGLGASQRRSSVDELLASFDLTGLAGRDPATLSGGQRARVALARALAPKPQVLLLDEPFGAVDVETRPLLQQALLATTPEHTVTIMVTHDPVEARVLSDQLIVLDRGRVTQHGTPIEVATSPATSFAADLLGTNLISGTASGTEVTLSTQAKMITATSATGTVHLTFSPSAITLHRDRPQGSARNVWPATVASVADLGGRVRVELTGPVEAAALVTPGAVAELGLHDGTKCWASLKATEITVLS